MMHRSRWSACLLGATLACGLLVWARPAAAEAGAPAEVSNFAIVYRVDPGEDLGAGEIRLWFSAPGRWRIETHTEKRDVTVVAAGARVVVEDRMAKGFLVMARDQARPPFGYVQPSCIDLSARYRDWADYVAARKRRLKRCEPEQGTCEVLGRSCHRYQSEFPLDVPPLPPGLLGGPVRMSLCVDDVLLVPLREESALGGKLAERIVATSVEVNGDLPESLFTLPIPPEARVFKGGVSRVPQEGLASVSTVAEDLSMMVGESVTVYVPSYVPEGFSDLGTMTDGEGKWFRADLASPSGATLVIAGSKDLSELPLPNLPGATPVSVGSWHGELGKSPEPFARTVLTWQAGDWHLRLDAAGVPAPEVMKVAASMHLEHGKPLTAFTDPKTAQAQVHFRVLVPTVLPPGAQLVASDVTPYQKGAGDSYTPEQMFLAYLAPGGSVSFSEMRGGEGMEIPGWEGITIAGRPGWYHHDPDAGHEFEWVQDGTDISLTGTLSKEEMLKIAESFVPADPSARVPAERSGAEQTREPTPSHAYQLELVTFRVSSPPRSVVLSVKLSRRDGTPIPDGITFDTWVTDNLLSDYHAPSTYARLGAYGEEIGGDEAEVYSTVQTLRIGPLAERARWLEIRGTVCTETPVPGRADEFMLTAVESFDLGKHAVEAAVPARPPQQVRLVGRQVPIYPGARHITVHEEADAHWGTVSFIVSDLPYPSEDVAAFYGDWAAKAGWVADTKSPPQWRGFVDGTRLPEMWVDQLWSEWRNEKSGERLVMVAEHRMPVGKEVTPAADSARGQTVFLGIYPPDASHPACPSAMQ